MFSSTSDRRWSAIRRGGVAVDDGARERERERGSADGGWSSLVGLDCAVELLKVGAVVG